jgi:hypothetical protein
MRPGTVVASVRMLAILLLAAMPVACGVEPRARPAPREWAALLADAPVRRLRAALLVDARDCPAALEVVELFARAELAGAVGSVTLLVRDGRDSLARYADALLTAPVQLAVVPVPPSLRSPVRALGPGPRLLLVDPRGQVVWASRIHSTPADIALLAHAASRVADHYLATELATTRPRP